MPKGQVVKMYYCENERVWLCLDIFQSIGGNLVKNREH